MELNGSFDDTISGVNVIVFLANSLKIPCNVHMHIVH